VIGVLVGSHRWARESRGDDSLPALGNLIDGAQIQCWTVELVVGAQALGMLEEIPQYSAPMDIRFLSSGADRSSGE
jgi:hypothetical protein